MTHCTTKTIQFSSCKKRKVFANFTGGDITSDGGVLLLREVDNKLGLTKQLASRVPDSRQADHITHSMESLLKQRIYAIAAGYEDLNDHETLRNDIAFQTAVNRDTVLSSASTLCRMENQADRQVAFDFNRLFVEKFIESFKEVPKELVLDFDATDDLIHGEQEKCFYHGYYQNYCFLPLYVFCEDQMLVSYLRPSNIDGAKHAWAILALLVKRFREVWPKVKIIFRGDSGFCRYQMLRWCEKHDVKYIVGIAQNKRLLAQTDTLRKEAETQYEQTQIKQRLFAEFEYAAKSWKTKRRIIIKAEHTSKGSNPRFIVTNLSGKPQTLYDDVYCARGEMENRIKEQQLDLFADRTSCHDWWPNQFRLLLSSAAYVLLSTLRRILLQSSALAKAQCGTIRLKLIKIGAVIIRNTRRIRFLLSTNYPYQNLFIDIAQKLCSG